MIDKELWDLMYELLQFGVAFIPSKHSLLSSNSFFWEWKYLLWAIVSWEYITYFWFLMSSAKNLP
jgi:hypothetical protein